MRLVFILFVIILASSCKKAEDRRCWKSVGDDGEKEIELESFDKMYLKEHIDYVLIQDTVEKVVLKGGKNLLNFINVAVVDGRLEMYNDNKCSFFRTYKKKVVAEIHFKDIINIHYEGTENLTNEGILDFSYLTILIRDGAGPVKLNMNGETIFAIVSHGWGDFTFNGKVKNAVFNVWSNGYCDTYGLEVEDSLTVISNTPGTVKVNANNAYLKAEISNSGDIWYKGTTVGDPELYQYGTGELIQKN